MVRKHSEETKKKMRESALNSWKSGRKAWNKGLTKSTSSMVVENAKAISKSLIGHFVSKETRDKIGSANSGRILTKEHRLLISKGVKNNPNVMKSRFKKWHIQSDEINSKKASKGNKNPAWIDGRSYDKHYLPEFRRIRKEILKRDKCCQICGGNNKLCVHHINYNKDNNNPDNLLTLCNSCHSKTNHNRNRWLVDCKNIISFNKRECHKQTDNYAWRERW